MVSAEVSPEAIKKLRGFFKAGSVGGCAPESCGVCPVACSLRPRTGEFRSGSVLTVNKLAEVPSGFRGRITFNDLQSQRSGEPSMIRTSEKTCSECGKQDCSHLKT